MLPPKGFYVIASKPGEFYSYHGVSTGEDLNRTVKLRFISGTGITVLVKEIDGTSVIDLSETALAPGIYIVTAELNGISYRTRLVYMPHR